MLQIKLCFPSQCIADAPIGILSQYVATRKTKVAEMAIVDGTPAKLKAENRAASIAPSPPGVGTADPSVLASKNTKVVSNTLVCHPKAIREAQKLKPSAID